MQNVRIDNEEAILRIAVDYMEMPDLIVTSRQAQRLWNLPSDICDGALATLVGRGFLIQTRAGAFLRRGSSSAVSLPQAS
jgi:hypothetical protein